VLGAYTAFAVHAGVDWDWEVSGVTLTALVIGCVAVVAARRRGAHIISGSLRAPAVAIVLVVSLGMIVAFLGNGAL
jgi:hypothetical protein